ncbi:MAG: AEC family transporter [Pseudomonadota bacterium]
MEALLEITLPVFFVIGFGYVVAWRGVFSEAAVDGLVKFTQNFAIPCLLFRAISEIDLGASLSVSLLASFYFGAFACFFIGFLSARVLFNRNPVDAVAIGFCCLFSNSVLLGLPITERAYGTEALAGNFAIITFHAPLCYMLGTTAMEIARASETSVLGNATRVLRAMFRNPIVVAITLGILANVTAFPVPGTVVEGLDLMAAAALPAALFSLGGVLFQYRPEGDLKTIFMVTCISLVVHPMLVFGAVHAFALDTDMIRSAVLTAAMAPGVNAYVFANMYGAARRVAASSVLFGTAGSVVTVWVWLLILP